MTIKRSTGVPVRFGEITYGFGGGGYTGITAELDQVVEQAAQRLAAAYGTDVEIRFNSDRESGGAWLRTPDGANADLGICASLVTASARRGWERLACQYETEAASTGHFTAEQRQGAGELAAFWRQNLTENPEGQMTIMAHIRGQAVAEELRTELQELPTWNDGTIGYHHGAAGSVDGALARCLRFVPSPELAREADTERSTGSYADGQVIEYTSFDPSGYSAGQVVGYAGKAEHDDPADPLVYIRARSGSKPFPVRESQLRARGDQASTEARATSDGHCQGEAATGLIAGPKSLPRGQSPDAPELGC